MASSDKEGVVVTSPDPTENVRQLVIAEKTRNDDLRFAESRRVDESIAAERRRVDESIEATQREAALRASYEEKLRVAESGRTRAPREIFESPSYIIDASPSTIDHHRPSLSLR
jgi:hypothetical protein